MFLNEEVKEFITAQGRHKEEIILVFAYLQTFKTAFKNLIYFQFCRTSRSSKTAALKLNQAVFIWHFLSFSGRMKKRRTRPFILFTTSKITFKQGAKKRINRNFTPTFKKLLKAQLQHKYLHLEPPTAVRIELLTYGIKI